MKKFKKIIFSICFILAFILSINIKLFANEQGFTIDNNGNVDSLNLFNYNKNYTNNVNGISITSKEQSVVLNGTTTGGTYLSIGSYTLSSGTYSFKQYVLNGSYSGNNVSLNLVRFGILGNGISLDMISGTITLTNETTFDMVIWWHDANFNFNNLELGYMLNSGNEPLEYFPYGTYYNSSNTLNNNSYLSPFNIDYVESETFYVNGQLEQGEEPVGYGGTYLFYDIQHTNAQNQNSWKSIINFNRILPSMTILFNPTGNNIYSISVYKNEELIQYIPVRYNENLEESDYYFTLPEFNRIELYCDIVNLSAPNQEIKLANTYEQGYTYGYSNGYNEGYAQGESSSYGSGYSTGYQKGIREANQNSLYNMILAIVDTPIHIFKGIFDFNVLGINLTNFVLSLISILIVVWLLKFFL